jgi:tRNA dimethylallyltransferase
LVKNKLKLDLSLGVYNLDSINIWGLDLIKPGQQFSANHWLEMTKILLAKFWQENKLPIIVGGTGFWLKALLKPMSSFGIKPDLVLRKKLGKLSIFTLQNMLADLDENRFKTMNYSDKHNPRRLIRAIEVAKAKENISRKKTSDTFLAKDADNLMLVLTASLDFVKQKIEKRVEQRVKSGVLAEVKLLLEKGLDWDSQAMSALGYKQWQPYLKGEVSLAGVKKDWVIKELNYAKRQQLWFKKYFPRSQNTFWFLIEQPDWQKHVVKLVKSWYS